MTDDDLERQGKDLLQRSAPIAPILSVRDRWMQALGLVAAAGAGIARPLMTLVFGKLVDEFNHSDPTQHKQLHAVVDKYAVYFVYLFLGKYLLVYTYALLLNTVSTRVTCKLRQAYFNAIVRQPLPYFETCAPGSVVSDLSQNASTIEKGISEAALGIAIQAISTVVASVIIAFAQSWRLTLVMSTTVIALLGCLYVVGTWNDTFERRINDASKEAAEFAEEVLSSMAIVAAYGATGKMSRKYDTFLIKLKHIMVSSAPLSGLDYAASYFILLCAYSLSFWYGVHLLSQHRIDTGGKVVIVILCVNQATNALEKLIPSWDALSKAKVALSELKKVIALKPAEVGSGKLLSECCGRLEFQGISFGYPSRPDLKVFNDFNLVIEPGKTTAIVGPSGSGKSSIVNLIEKWYEPGCGRIVLDGKPITELDVFCYRSKIRLVQQDPALFNDSLFENVASGLPLNLRKGLSPNEISDLVHKACVDADVDGFAQSLPEGYQTRMGEKSSFLSGGQRQRVAIARALISNPEILLLDEATSALDPSAENVVQAALDRVSHGRTTLVVAHKLATIQKADKIVLLKDGKIIEEGDHSSLLGSNGHYTKMLDRQTLHVPVTLNPGDSGEDEKRPSPVETEKPASRKSEEVLASDGIEPPAPESHNTKISFLSCLAMIFREQQKMRNPFLIGCVACVAAGAVYPGQAVVFAKSVSVFDQDHGDLVRTGTFWALLWFVLAVGVCLAFLVSATIFTIVGATIMRVYRQEYFSSMLKQDMLFFAAASSSSAALTARLLSHTQQLESLVSRMIGSMIIVLVNVISSCALSIAIAWKLALVAIVGVFPLISLAGFLQVNLSFKCHSKDTNQHEEVLRFASECVTCIRTISSLTMETEVCGKFEAKLKALVVKVNRNTILTMLLFALSQSANLLGSALCFWYGGGLVASGEIDSFQFFVVFIATVASGDAAGSFFANSKSIATAHSAASHIFSLRDGRVAADASHTEAKYTPQTISSLEFRDVSFAYPNRLQSPVLQHLNFGVTRGQNIAIVGASGSGKSTITALLERFYDVDGGSILVNGNPIQSLDLGLYRSMVSLVSQETVLYRGTIEENVLVGFEETSQVSHDDVIQACQDANIHDFILTLPEGYNTVCGIKGASLSGGQRQRLAIARALVRNSPVLLLDEATSALDTESEHLVQGALNRAMEGRLAITIAHRLSTIKNADCIYVLSKGSFREWGSHDILLQKRGLYYTMCEAQQVDSMVPEENAVI